MNRQPHENEPTASAARVSATGSDSPAPGDALLAVRRKWFASFPEGPLEFVAAVRIVWILGIFAAPVVGGFLRTYATIAVALLLLVDAGLMMWWLTGLAADHGAWLAGRSLDPSRGGKPPAGPLATVVLSQGLLFAFGLTFMSLPIEAARLHPGAMAVARWIIFAAYVASVPLMFATCRSAGLNGRWSVVLLAVPFLHWWTVRRFAAELGAGFAGQAAQRLGRDADFSRAAFILADVLWAFLVLIVVVDLAMGGIWAGLTFRGLCSGSIIAVAAIADVAAVEAAQHAYLTYLRSASRPGRS
jgi:hypothetical protein